MNEYEEINQQLTDIKLTLEKQDKIMFAIGLMVIGMGGMVMLGLLLYFVKVGL